MSDIFKRPDEMNDEEILSSRFKQLKRNENDLDTGSVNEENKEIDDKYDDNVFDLSDDGNDGDEEVLASADKSEKEYINREDVLADDEPLFEGEEENGEISYDQEQSQPDLENSIADEIEKGEEIEEVKEQEASEETVEGEDEINIEVAENVENSENEENIEVQDTDNSNDEEIVEFDPSEMMIKELEEKIEEKAKMKEEQVSASQEKSDEVKEEVKNVPKEEEKTTENQIVEEAVKEVQEKVDKAASKAISDVKKKEGKGKKKDKKDNKKDNKKEKSSADGKTKEGKLKGGSKIKLPVIIVASAMVLVIAAIGVLAVTKSFDKIPVIGGLFNKDEETDMNVPDTTNIPDTTDIVDEDETNEATEENKPTENTEENNLDTNNQTDNTPVSKPKIIKKSGVVTAVEDGSITIESNSIIEKYKINADLLANNSDIKEDAEVNFEYEDMDTEKVIFSISLANVQEQSDTNDEEDNEDENNEETEEDTEDSADKQIQIIGDDFSQELEAIKQRQEEERKKEAEQKVEEFDANAMETLELPMEIKGSGAIWFRFAWKPNETTKEVAKVEDVIVELRNPNGSLITVENIDKYGRFWMNGNIFNFVVKNGVAGKWAFLVTKRASEKLGEIGANAQPLTGFITLQKAAVQPEKGKLVVMWKAVGVKDDNLAVEVIAKNGDKETLLYGANSADDGIHLLDSAEISTAKLTKGKYDIIVRVYDIDTMTSGGKKIITAKTIKDEKIIKDVEIK